MSREILQEDADMGQRLRKFRKSLGLTIPQVALIFDVQSGTIGNLERGVSRASLTMLREYSKLGMNMEYALNGQLPMNKEEKTESKGKLTDLAEISNNYEMLIAAVDELRRVNKKLAADLYELKHEFKNYTREAAIH